MTNLKAVMFDLDETLLNRTASLKHFVSDQRARFPVLQQLEERELQTRFIDLDRRGTVSKDRVYEQLLAAVSIEDAEMRDVLWRDYETNFWRFAVAFPGLKSLFSDLHKAGLKTAIITNGQTHIQLRSILALNLDRLVDTYLISEVEGLRKPDPEIFHRAARRLNVASADCVFVGDNPVADILGARTCGMRTIWFANNADWPETATEGPAATISHLGEIAPLLAQWG